MNTTAESLIESGTVLPSAPRHAVAIVSGGLDSTVLTYLLLRRGAELTMLSFDYGQRHRKELDYARASSADLGVQHQVVDLTAVVSLISGSALTDSSVPVPDGHYTDRSMRATVVPNRNAIMLDIAVAHAVAIGADAVAIGAHAGDHPIYPDCRPEFLTAFERTALVGNEGFIEPGFRVLAPFADITKADIVRLGNALAVPFASTWSCYRGGAVHCGSCGTCVERREAFVLAGVVDPTEYLTAQEAR